VLEEVSLDIYIFIVATNELSRSFRTMPF
jgi:hypothetical protein